MSRRRRKELALPDYVHRVRSHGRVYYYYQPYRGTNREAERVKVAGDPLAPVGSPENLRFWAELNAIAGAKIVCPPGSLGALVDLYRTHHAYKSLNASTKATYDVHLNRFMKAEGWGLLNACKLTPVAVDSAVQAIKDTPVMANQMLAVGATLYDWALPLGHLGPLQLNPFKVVKPLPIEDKGHIPWPEWVVNYVSEQAPTDLVRMVRLGIATCQRESDLVRLGPERRSSLHGGPGIWCRPTKTRKRRRSVFIPLATVDALELDRWATTPILFMNSRWKEPMERLRADLYLYSPRGAAYKPHSLRARYHRWLATKEGQELCRLWKKWLGEMVRKYEWDIDPEDAKGPTIHGLRGTGILLRFAAGFDSGQIGNDIGAHLSTVERYMRFRDQMEMAVAGPQRLRLVNTEG